MELCSVQHRQYHLRFWNLTPSYLGFEPPSASFKLTVEPFLNLHVHTSTLSQDSSDEEIATLSMMNNSRRPLLPNCAILDILLLCRCLFRSCTWSSQSGTAIYFATAACQGCSKFTFAGRWEGERARFVNRQMTLQFPTHFKMKKERLFRVLLVSVFFFC